MVVSIGFYFLRHGSQIDDQVNSPLSEQGKKEAENAKQLIQSFKFATVYSSSLKRAQETKAIVLDGGSNYEDIVKEALAENQAAAIDMMQNGENLQPASRDYIAKIGQVVDEILTKQKPILVIAHAGTYLAIQHSLKIREAGLPDHCQCVRFLHNNNQSWEVSTPLSLHRKVRTHERLASR